MLSQAHTVAAVFAEDAGKFDAFQCVALPDDSSPRLFIGPREALYNEAELRHHGITHVLSVMKGATSYALDESHFSRLTVETAVDNAACDLLSQWPACCDFVDGALAAGGNVLVHSNAGVSRSGASMVAYLVHRLRRPCGECLVIVQRARNAVAPNDGFQAQLLSWERKCIGSVHVAGGAHMHEIRQRLWLGSLDASQDWERLKECGISHVLTCGRGLEGQLPDGMQRLCTLGIDDLDEVDILEHLPRTSDQIADALEDSAHRVLVHCAAGRSRSASVVIAYIMRKEGQCYLDARRSVEAIRSVVQLNSGFTHQLEWYGRNSCPADLKDVGSGKYYSQIPEFLRLLRRYSAADVRTLMVSVGVADDNCTDPKALQRGLDALDRLQNAVPLDDEARDEKRRKCRRINAALDS